MENMLIKGTKFRSIVHGNACRKYILSWHLKNIRLCILSRGCFAPLTTHTDLQNRTLSTRTFKLFIVLGKSEPNEKRPLEKNELCASAFEKWHQVVSLSSFFLLSKVHEVFDACYASKKRATRIPRGVRVELYTGRGGIRSPVVVQNLSYSM